MAIRALLAGCTLALSVTAAAEAPAPVSEPGTVIWVPVMLPPANLPGPYYFLPPPFLWWLQAVPQPAFVPPAETPSTQAMPPLSPAAPVSVAPAVEAAPPSGAGVPSLPSPATTEAETTPPPAPPSSPSTSARAIPEDVSIQALAPLADGAPPPATKPTPRAKAKPPAAKAKPRKLCWKDNALAPCP